MLDMKIAFLLFAAVLSVAACSSSDDGAGEFSSAPTATTPAPVATPESVEPSPEPTPAIDRALYPEGFPEVVPVSSLPDQVRNWYEMSDLEDAVAIAPGVWTELPRGAELIDALSSQTRDGFCASIKAYERKYLGGEEAGGTCW